MTLDELGIAIRPNGPAEQRVPCPRCGRDDPHDDALGVNIETSIYHCFRCGWSGRAFSGETRAAVVRLDDPDRAHRVRDRLQRIWTESVPLRSVPSWPIERYLQSRGLGVFLAHDIPALRAHPSLAYYDTAARREIGRYPALIARLTG